jgi:uncharacterized membrane protein (DUF106 family)
MENEPKVTNAETTPLTPSPTPTTDVSGTPTLSKKTPVWVWILSGCLIVSILTMIIFGIIAYLGFKKAKHEINKQKPNFEQMQKDFEKAGKDAQEWQEQAEEIQKSMPTPEDLNYPMPE